MSSSTGTAAWQQEIGQRLRQPVQPLPSDMSLPPEVAARVGKGTYGQARETESSADVSSHVQQVMLF